MNLINRDKINGISVNYYDCSKCYDDGVKSFPNEHHILTNITEKRCGWIDYDIKYNVIKKEVE